MKCYNPRINSRAILLALLGHVVPNRGAGIRQSDPVRVDICLTIFYWQESMTQSQQCESLFSFYLV